MSAETYVPITHIPHVPIDYPSEVVRLALSTVGVREETRNRGPEVDRYVEACGLPPSQRAAWCMCWVYWAHLEAARGLGGATTCPRTPGAAASFILARAAGLETATAQEVREGRFELRPGDQYVRVRTGRPEDVAAVLAGRRRKGHTGIITSVDPLESTDGNTNGGGSRDGDGVYTRPFDLDMPELVGFVRHGLA